jgi:hypothetical protein
MHGATMRASVDFNEICNFFENANNVLTKFEVLSGENIEVMSLRCETPSNVVCRCHLVAIYSHQDG